MSICPFDYPDHPGVSSLLALEGDGLTGSRKLSIDSSVFDSVYSFERRVNAEFSTLGRRV